MPRIAPSSHQAPRVVVLGGGFGGSAVARDRGLQQVADVTLVDTKKYLELTWATLRSLVDPKDFAPKTMWDHRDYLGDATLVVGRCVKVDPGIVTLEGGVCIPYDFLVVATGSSYPAIGKNDQETRRQRLAYLEKQANIVASSESILIVGGGPVGVEFAAEVADYFPGKTVHVVQHNDRLLPTFDEVFSEQAESHLESRGIRLHFNDSVFLESRTGLLVGKRTITTARGVELDVDLIFNAMGQTPNAKFMPHETLSHNGLIEVDESCRVRGYANIWAIGDCSDFPCSKLGSVAIAQGQHLAQNLTNLARRTIDSGPSPFNPEPELFVVSLGRSACINTMSGCAGCIMGSTLSKQKSENLFTNWYSHKYGVPSNYYLLPPADTEIE